MNFVAERRNGRRERPGCILEGPPGLLARATEPDWTRDREGGRNRTFPPQYRSRNCIFARTAPPPWDEWRASIVNEGGEKWRQEADGPERPKHKVLYYVKVSEIHFIFAGIA